MAAGARPAFAYTTQYLEHGGLEIPHMIVPPDHPRYDADFFRVAYECARSEGEPVRATRAELEYVRDNVCIVCMPRIACFGDIVQSAEFPDLIAIPPSALDAACNKEIIVFMCHFVLQSGELDCYYLGFCLRDNIGVCSRSPVGDDLLISAGALRPVHALIATVRAKNTPMRLSASASSVEQDGAPPPRALCASIDMVLAGTPAAGNVQEPGAYIFCRFDNLPEFSGTPAFVEQICARAVARMWCYNSMKDGEVGAYVKERMDTLFSSKTASDFAHEFVVVFVLTIMLKDRTDFFVQSELALMEYRIAHKLPDYDTRMRFLALNGLVDEFERHQLVCTHERFTCLVRFVLDVYSNTLTRLARIASFLMYDMPEDKMRPSDHAHVDILTQLVESASRAIRAARR
jgi:hypothetical protein